MNCSADKNITIRPVREEEFSIVFDLCEKRFGKGYLDREEFEQWLRQPQLFLAAECEGVFCGCVCYLPEEIDDLARYMRLTSEYVRSVSGGKPVIHCKTAVVVPEYERCGIMQGLVAAANENARELGYGAAFAPAWKHDGQVPVGKLLCRLGFEKLAEAENIWYDMEKYTCVVCGGRCKCTAVIFQKRL